MNGVARYKVRGGKLIVVKVEYGTAIEDIQILGDFFMHPEDSIFEVEAKIKGLPLESLGGIEGVVSQLVSEKHIEMVGIDAQSIGKAVREAVGWHDGES